MGVEEFSEAPGSIEPRGLERYLPLKSRVMDCIGGMLNLSGLPGDFLGDLKEKLENNRFNLVVVGQFKRGKTCLINALLGADLLPTAVVPLTSIVTVLSYGEEIRAEVRLNDGTSAAISPGELPAYVTEVGNPRNVKNVREVNIEYPSAYLKDGVRLIDTPGVGSVYLHNTDVAYRYLPHCDAALFLLSVEQPVGKAELDFLKDVQVYSNRIFFLLNKIDILSDQEVEESMSFSRSALEDVVGPNLRMFPVSAKLALNGKLEGSNDLLNKSRLPAFSRLLNQFFMEEKGKVLLLSSVHALLRILRQGRLERELETKAITTPLHELEEKIALFEARRDEVLAEKDAFLILLEGEVKKLIRHVVDADLAAFKKDLIHRMEEGFDAFQAEKKDLSLKELRESLETYVTGEVEQAISAWRPMEEDKIGQAFQAMCDRFLRRINGILDSLLQFSSQLFSVHFEPITSESEWKVESRFYYKFAQEPVGLDMLESSLTEVFPGYISDRFKKIKAFLFGIANRRIVRKRREHLYQTIEMQVGRIRADLLERLNSSMVGFRREMLKKVESTAEGIAAAIEKGRKQKSQGEKGVMERQEVLLAEMAAIDAIREELTDIEQSAALL